MTKYKKSIAGLYFFEAAKQSGMLKNNKGCWEILINGKERAGYAWSMNEAKQQIEQMFG